jgi:rhodanese-related sulfurtransferase/DNA-binding transcriptional ArsR family regulator
VFDREFRARLYAEFAELGKSLSSGHRLELLDLLAQGQRTVESLAQASGLSIANTSAHLQVLRRARLVEADKTGLYVHYRLASPDVFDLWRTLRDVGRARLAEVDRLVDTYMADRSRLEGVTRERLLELLADDAVTVIDVRPAIEYRQGHIISARLMPLEELENRLGELPNERRIVAYCRGPFCVLADEAVLRLVALGRDASRLEDGFPEWRRADLPYATGD